MHEFVGKVAVVTGAASGFGREFARRGASLGMKLVLADIERGALDEVVQALRAGGTDVIGEIVDVRGAEDVARLARRTLERHGAVHLLFNNAGVATGGLVWESSENDWQWTLGVNLWGVIHGVRTFVPIMLAQGDECHVVNTASVAGLIAPQAMGAYNVSKHGVVALSETLHHDLRLVGARIGVTLLCPAYVPTGIVDSQRNRPAELLDPGEPTDSMRAAQAAMAKAVCAGRIGAAEVARMTFEAIRENRFYVITHPKILDSVQLRLEDIVARRNPSDPYTFKPGLAQRAGHTKPGDEVELRTGDWPALGAQALAVRTAVFVREQGIPLELEHDAHDANAVHCLALRAGCAIGTGRLLPDGRIGRMAVLVDARRSGIGRKILEALVAEATARGHVEIELHAQCSVEGFYRAQGFETVGEPFEEAGIAHVTMRRSLPRA